VFRLSLSEALAKDAIMQGTIMPKNSVSFASHAREWNRRSWYARKPDSNRQHGLLRAAAAKRRKNAAHGASRGSGRRKM